MMFAICSGFSASPRPAGISNTFRTVLMLARLRKTMSGAHAAMMLPLLPGAISQQARSRFAHTSASVIACGASSGCWVTHTIVGISQFVANCCVPGKSRCMVGLSKSSSDGACGKR